MSLNGLSKAISRARVPICGDQRLTRIALTARGQRAARAMRGIVREVEGEWEQRLGPEHFAQLRVLLTDLNAHVAADGAPDHGTPAAN